MGNNQGEGDRESAKRYNEDQKEFVESGKVEQAREDRANVSPEEKEELREAEDLGKSRAKD